MILFVPYHRRRCSERFGLAARPHTLIFSMVASIDYNMTTMRKVVFDSLAQWMKMSWSGKAPKKVLSLTPQRDEAKLKPADRWKPRPGYRGHPTEPPQHFPKLPGPAPRWHERGSTVPNHIDAFRPTCCTRFIHRPHSNTQATIIFAVAVSTRHQFPVASR